MSPIDDLKLSYEAPNGENAFTAGDTIRGTLTFTLTKDTKVKSVSVKVTGRAHVHWSRGSGKNRRSYTANRIYFKIKQPFVEKKSDGTELSKGDYCHKFSIKIPPEDLPSSFKGFHGKVVYMLEAKISRGMRLPSLVQKELKFTSKLFPYTAQCPVSGSVEKGKVHMSATVDKQVCFPGDTLTVVAKISNSSSKTMKPKFTLIQRVIYRARASTNHSLLPQCKWVGESIGSKSEETVSCRLTVPDDAIYSMNNCDIITVAYFVLAYLDISFAFDPEVELPVVIVPARFASHKHDEVMGPTGAPSNSDFPLPAISSGPYPGPTGPNAPLQPGQAYGPYPAGAVCAPGYSSFPSAGPYPAPTGPNAPFQPGQAFGPCPAGAVGAPGYSSLPSSGPYPAPTVSGAYGYLTPAPAQHTPTSGFNNQWPQQASPYGYPSTTHQLHTHPTHSQIQEGENPPNYSSLFPDSS